MLPIDRLRFWTAYRQHFGRVTSSRKVASLETLLDLAEQEPDLEVAQLAYIMATVGHETAGAYRPIREYGQGRGRPYGKPVRVSSRRTVAYYGRGFVQLTWLANYYRQSVKLGVDLVTEPDRALEPANAWRILVGGMMDGDFNPNGKGLGAYVSSVRRDYFEARRTVNLLDRAEEIAAAAVGFEAALG